MARVDRYPHKHILLNTLQRKVFQDKGLSQTSKPFLLDFAHLSLRTAVLWITSPRYGWFYNRYPTSRLSQPPAMVVLTDLPDELLLSIVADVSPLYIETLALSCKRLYGLCAEVIREHDRVRSDLPTANPCLLYGPETRAYDLLRLFFQNPRVAEYPTSWNFNDSVQIDDAPEDLIDAINIHALRSPYAYLFETEKYRPSVADLVIPLVITQLVNVRKIQIMTTSGPWRYVRETRINAPYLIEFMSKIIKTSHNPKLSLQEPSILGRLKEVEIISLMDGLSGTELALLLSMVPTLRKLHVFELERERPYVCPHKYRVSGVTDMLLDGQIDSEYIVELVQRTKSLHSFTYLHYVNTFGVIFEPRRLLATLKERARQSLIFLCLSTAVDSYWSPDNLDGYPSCRDLSLGSLREFKDLKYLVTGVEMFIKTRGRSEDHRWKGKVQRLVSWLPASLETLVLVERLNEWKANTLRMLFRGFRNQKQLRLPNLKHIKFHDFYMFKQGTFNAIKVACRETGVTIRYTSNSCYNCHSHGRIPKCLHDWEDHDWKDFSEDY